MEKADESLEDRLKKATLSEEEVKVFSKQIISGLQHIHELNIIHCDLKPGNLLIVGNIIKLADFGLSTIMEFNENISLQR